MSTTAQVSNPHSNLVDGISVAIDAASTQTTDFSIVNSGSLEISGSASADTISVTSANAVSVLKIDDTRDFQGSVTFNDSVIDLGGLISGVTEAGFAQTDVLSWSLHNGVLALLNAQGGRAAHFNFTDASPTAGKTTNIEVSQLGSEFYITEGTLHQPAGANLLYGDVDNPLPTTPTVPVATNPDPPTTTPVVTPPNNPPQPPVIPPVAQAAVVISDGLTGQPVTTIPAQLYAGPVAGLQQQVISVTAQNLNIFAVAPNLFIHTGSGNDAIQVSSGTNVLDGGTGSNFLTAGTGTDTFFVDARGAASDTWSTISKFHSGDAVTLWGVSASTPAQWLDGQGATGATGLTLHAGPAGGPTASVTLAGFSKADLASGKVTASFGHDAASGSDYLYVHAG